MESASKSNGCKTRICPDCQLELPLTASYFDRKRDAEDGFRSVCKQCRKDARESENSTALSVPDEGLGALDQKTLLALQKSMQAPGSNSRLPHVTEVYEAAMQILGGAQGFAQHVVATTMAAPLGSLARLRGLAIINEWNKSVSENHQADQQIGDMSSEDLEEYVRKMMLMQRAQTLQRQQAPLDGHLHGPATETDEHDG